MVKIPTFLIIAALILSFIPAANAVAIGASPATLNFEVPRGSPVEKTLQISTNSGDYVGFTLTKSPSLADFVTLSSSTGKMKSGEPSELTVKVSVPSKTALGNYSGTISIRTAGVGDLSGGSGSVISTGIAVKVIIIVSETAKSSDQITGSFLGVGSKNVGFGFVFVIIAVILGALAVVFLARPRNRTRIETWR